MLAGLSLVLVLLPTFAPLEWLFPTLLGPFPITILAVKYPWRHVLWLIGLQAGVLLVITALPSLLLLAQYSVVGLTLGAAMRLGYTASRTISWSVALPIGIGAVVLLFVSAMAQQTPHAYLIHMFEQMADGLYEQLRQMEGLRNEEAMAAALEAFLRTMAAVLPAVCAVNFLFPNVLNYLLARRYLQNQEPPIPFAPADIADWRATDYLVWVFLAAASPCSCRCGAQLHRPERLSRHSGALFHTRSGHFGLLVGAACRSLPRRAGCWPSWLSYWRPHFACWHAPLRACSICGSISGANAVNYRSTDPDSPADNDSTVAIMSESLNRKEA